MSPQTLLCFNVYATSLAFTRFYKPLLEPLGLTYPQYLVVLSLHARGEQTVSQLSGDLGLESNTLSPLLKRMAAAGQVVRTRSLEDERVVRVALTDTGRALAFRANQIPQCIQACIDIPAGDLAQTAALLGNLRQILDTTPVPVLP